MCPSQKKKKTILFSRIRTVKFLYNYLEFWEMLLTLPFSLQKNMESSGLETLHSVPKSFRGFTPQCFLGMVL